MKNNIPEFYYNYKNNFRGYKYKSKLYSDLDLSEMFIDFLGFYLDYHLSIAGKIVVVHSLFEVIEKVVNNYESFEILEKYKDEYSKDEYKQIIKLLNYLKERKRPKEFERVYSEKDKLSLYIRIKDYCINFRYNKMLKEMSKYDYKIPTKVYSKWMKEYFYVVDGNPYWTILEACEEIYHIGFYYQYNGDGVKDSYNHEHQHDFENVIHDVIREPKEFIIYDYQKEFFSKQEIKFLNGLAKKLKNI